MQRNVENANRTESQPARESTPSLDTPPTLNIEDRNLPGNVGWLARVANATEGRWVRWKTEATTLPDRVRAGSWERTEERAKTRSHLLTQQRQEQMMRKMEAQSKLQEIQFSGMHWSNKIPMVRWINEQRTAWQRTKIGWAESTVKKYDGRIKESRIMQENATTQRGIYDASINMRVTRNERRLEDKLRPIEGLRAEAEEAIERLSTRVETFARISETHNERLQELMKLRIQKPETESEARERDNLMEKLNTERLRAELLLKQAEQKLSRVYTHQRRIGRAHATLTGAKERIDARYMRAIYSRSVREGSEDAVVAEEMPETETPSIELLARAISGEDVLGQSMTPERFISLWNRVAPGARIQSKEQIVGWWNKAMEQGITHRAPTPEEQETFGLIQNNEAIVLKDWKTIINRLVQFSPEFKARCARETGIETTNDAFYFISIIASDE